MKSRVVLIALVLGVLSMPLLTEAQPANTAYRIGVLSLNPRGASSQLFEAFEHELRDRGYVEGRNITFEYRFADGRPERLPAMAAEVVRLKVDVIMAAADSQARAARQATTTMASGEDSRQPPAVQEREQARYRTVAGKPRLDVPAGTLNAILKQAGLKKAGSGE